MLVVQPGRAAKAAERGVVSRRRRGRSVLGFLDQHAQHVDAVEQEAERGLVELGARLSDEVHEGLEGMGESGEPVHAEGAGAALDRMDRAEQRVNRLFGRAVVAQRLDALLGAGQELVAFEEEDALEVFFFAVHGGVIPRTLFDGREPGHEGAEQPKVLVGRAQRVGGLDQADLEVTGAEREGGRLDRLDERSRGFADLAAVEMDRLPSRQPARESRLQFTHRREIARGWKFHPIDHHAPLKQ